MQSGELNGLQLTCLNGFIQYKYNEISVHSCKTLARGDPWDKKSLLKKSVALWKLKNVVCKWLGPRLSVYLQKVSIAVGLTVLYLC